MWPDRRLLDLIGTELPVIQAPMAGASGSAMAIAVSEAGVQIGTAYLFTPESLITDLHRAALRTIRLH